MRINQILRRLTNLEQQTAPPNAIQQSRIVVVFVAPGADGEPNKVVGELEFIIDLPTGGGR
jgi:hypothetical protein